MRKPGAGTDRDLSAEGVSSSENCDVGASHVARVLAAVSEVDLSVPGAVATGDVSRSISRRRTRGRTDRGASWPSSQSFGGRAHGCSWYARHQPRCHLGRQCRQRLAAAVVDSRHRSRINVWARGVSRSRRSRRRKAAVQIPHDSSDARYYWSVAEVGDRHLLVVLRYAFGRTKPASSGLGHSTHALTGGFAPGRGQGV